MRRPRPADEGSEIVQLAFAMPLLLLAFVVAAQLLIWGFEVVQFSSAGESVAYDIDVDALGLLDPDSDAAKSLVRDEIASRMLGAEAQSVSVESVGVDASSGSAAIAPAQSETDAFRYSAVQATSRVSFTARFTCPSLFEIGDPLVLERTWQRDRLLYRRAEVSR